ncbi:8170_t:CDS:2 [Funneliformis geosporum]|uniref:19778_t:CDS:1 n=1 Tax=Funneliformis geosporum TaxID=1117311 RepID=A0A9W4SSI2_9GLOM|nr:19778_t:CDS:2 [Funneliformis geosporum]CAI2177832.1 8170_t:CDS:2 [Funneliformis geosporum]
MSSELQNHIEISEPDLSSQIYKATYSGVPVWEFRVRNVAVMRRKTDSWLNATQILKVAEFDKPHRTRILEREVQKGEHEKVQGGYGKYQGTWVPYETGVDLAERYHVKELLQPIINFQPTSQSPPLAPKHVTAASNKPRKPREPKEPKPIKPRLPKKLKKAEQIEDAMEIDSDHETNEIVSVASTTNVTVSPISSLTTTPAPIDSSNDLTESDDTIPVQKTKRKRKQPEPATAPASTNTSNRPTKIAKNSASAQFQQYGMLLLAYFTSNGTTIPDFVINPPTDFDPNVVIDQQGHTALHWAAAMANIEMTSLLSKAGSDLDRGNIHGETALMRSVMFSYNYDNRSFNDMVQILHTTIPNLDISDQTVLHHVAVFASSKGCIGPSRYYMEILLSNLALHPNEEYRKAIINKQNHEGDTALNISARYANKKLVRLLMDAGADPQIRNALGKNAEDYILELDHEAKVRAASEHQAHLQNAQTINNLENQEITAVASSSSIEVSGTTPTVTSSTGVQVSQNFLPNITSILQEFENSYQSQIQEKDQELSVSRSQLETVINDLNTTKFNIDALRDKIRVLPARKDRINELIDLVRDIVEKRRQCRLDATISQEMKNVAPLQGGNADKLAELKQQLEDLKASRRHLMRELIKTKTTAPDQIMTPYKRVIGLFSGEAGSTSVSPQIEMSI